MTTDFFKAVRERDAATVRKELQNGFKLDTLEDGASALHVACTVKNNVVVLGELLAAKADVNLTTASGYTALHYAASNNAGPITVVILAKAGADVNAVTKQKWTALHCVSDQDSGWDDVMNKDRIAMVNGLLYKGAEPSLSIKNTDGQTPADFARHKSRKTLSEWLQWNTWMLSAEAKAKQEPLKAQEPLEAKQEPLEQQPQTDITQLYAEELDHRHQLEKKLAAANEELLLLRAQVVALEKLVDNCKQKHPQS